MRLPKRAFSNRVCLVGPSVSKQCKAVALLVENRGILDVRSDCPADNLKRSSGEIYVACKSILDLTKIGSTTKVVLCAKLAPVPVVAVQPAKSFCVQSTRPTTVTRGAGQIRNYPSTTPGAESTLDSVVSRLIFVSIVDVTPVPRKFPLTGPAKRGVADAATAM